MLVTGSNRGLGHHFVEQALVRGAKRVYAANRNGQTDFTDPRVVPLALDLRPPRYRPRVSSSTREERYAATKAAAWSLTQALRIELRSDGIAVHASFPGMIDTDMVKGYPGDKALPLTIANGTLDGIEGGTRGIGPDATSAGALATYLKNPNDLIAMFAG